MPINAEARAAVTDTVVGNVHWCGEPSDQPRASITPFAVTPIVDFPSCPCREIYAVCHLKMAVLLP